MTPLELLKILEADWIKDTHYPLEHCVYDRSTGQTVGDLIREVIADTEKLLSNVKIRLEGHHTCRHCGTLQKDMELCPKCKTDPNH